MERVATQPTFKNFRLTKLHLPPSRPESIERFPFEFELGKKWYRSWDHLLKDLEILWHKQVNQSLEEVAIEVMNVNKVVGLFQTMAIVHLNMGNLILEVDILKNKLVMGEKVVL